MTRRVGLLAATVITVTAVTAVVVGTRDRGGAAIDAGTVFVSTDGNSQSDTFPGTQWQRARQPADVGWSEEKLAAAWKFAREIGSGAILIVQRGVIVAAWGDINKTYDVFSIRKSLLHALMGPLVESGTLDLDAPIAKWEIDDIGGLTTAEKQARLRDLLSSRSGVYHAAAYEARDNASQRPRRGSHAPGEFFYYNNWDFNALGTIYERASKSSIFDDFQSRIAAPLEMEDFSVAHTEYVRERQSEHAAYVFRMTARDLARFGMLYLREGRWRSKQIVPQAWIKMSIQSYSKGAQPFSDYGYLWWVYPAWSGGLYGASGKGNQKVVVWPGQDAVIVHLADTKTWGLLGREVGSVDFWKLMSLISAAAPAK